VTGLTLPTPEYVPGLLSEELGWVWRQLGTSTRLHLIPALVLAKGQSACGRRLTDVRLGARTDRVYCELCRHRNGGQAP
jgi:hypothetical protein